MPKLLSTDLATTHLDLCAKSQRILELREEVFSVWETEVRAKVRGAENTAGPILINTLPLLYGNIVQALCPDFYREKATANTTAAAGHGGERARSRQYRAVDVVHEYQLLRDSLLTVCELNNIRFTAAELAILVSSFDSAIRDAVSEFNCTQTAFHEHLFATLTHEVRTSLSLILASAELLTKQPENQVGKLATRILDNGRKLEKIFTGHLDLLDRSLQAGDCTKIVSCNALEIAHKARENFSLCNSRVCEVVGEPVSGWWDHGLLLRALENLVDNASKHGSSSSAIKIEVVEAFNRLIIAVHNFGNPISEERLGELFRYLNRKDPCSSKDWGVGLPFVQDVANSHGGTVVIDSSEKTGTTFLIDIPSDARILNKN